MRRLAQLHNKENKHQEPLWHVQIAILVIILLQFVLDSSLSLSPKHLLTFTELGILIVLMVIAQLSVRTKVVRRTLAVLLTGLVTIANIISLILLTHSLLTDSQTNSSALLLSALAIYVTNVIVFGLWYWELEFRRVNGQNDILFPQEGAVAKDRNWEPTFFDYLYFSLVNATSFSATDSLPLTHRVKALMSIQSLVSLIIVVLVTARAVSIIG